MEERDGGRPMLGSRRSTAQMCADRDGQEAFDDVLARIGKRGRRLPLGRVRRPGEQEAGAGRRPYAAAGQLLGGLRADRICPADAAASSATTFVVPAPPITNSR